MKSDLKILLLEDEAGDAELIKRELKSSGFAFRLARIETETELRREMEADLPDLILSDHGLPSFNGFRALQIVREKHPQLPFIFVSGSNDQGMVARMYEEGATDYVFKRDMGDLKPAVLRALEPPLEEQLPAESEVVQVQPELEMQLPAPTPGAPVFPAIGHLSFCPNCRQSWDETGALVPMETYCSSRAEIIVIRQPCSNCERWR